MKNRGDKLEAMLRAWGHFYGERRPKEWDEAAEVGEANLTASHPIARAMEYAGGQAVSRARSAWGMKKIRGGVPLWGFDPVKGKDTRSFRVSTPDDVPREIQRIQTIWLELYRADTLRAMIVQTEYCRRGTQGEKAAMLKAQGFAVGLRVYRENLAFARGWIESRLEF